MLRKMEERLYRIVWSSRMILVIPVIMSLVAALILILMGTYDVIIAVGQSLSLFNPFAAFNKLDKEILAHVISSVDSYLFATVLLIFSIGLYRLGVVSSKARAECDSPSARMFFIKDLDEMKDKIAKVIILLLIVTFFQRAVQFNYSKIIDILYLSIGIFLVALAVFFTHRIGLLKSGD